MNIKSCEEYFDADGNKLHIMLDEYEFVYEEIKVKLNRLPLLKNLKDDTLYFPRFSEYIVRYMVKEAKDRNIPEITITPPEYFLNRRFKFCDDLPFKYSAIEYFVIPRLANEFSNSGFLTPVYFELDLLNKYSQHPDYKLTILSSTYGDIQFKDEWHISFGVNNNKKVVMWLGDINELPENEQYYLLSENIDPQFNLHSEFYKAQIDVQWAEPSIENEAFQARNTMIKLGEQLHQASFYKLEGEIARVIGNLQKPIFWEHNHVEPVVEALNRIFVESLNEKGLKQIIHSLDQNVDLNGLKGLKLLSIYLLRYSDKTTVDNIMKPFFVLYDYRVVLCHLQSDKTVDKKMQTINERLNLPRNNINHEEIYMTLFELILSSICNINEFIAKQTKISMGVTEI